MTDGESQQLDSPDDQKPGQDERSTVIAAGEYVAPVLNRKAFHCPYCGVYAQQGWTWLVRPGQPLIGNSTPVYMGRCGNCGESTYWLADSAVPNTTEQSNAVLLWPQGSANAPQAHPDFPDGPREEYDEARGIVDRSPRGAVALLRLALQKLCQALGEPGKNINDDVAALVSKGLPPGVQEALDSLRVIGNNAVHPGQLDLRDDRETAIALFGLLNFIVEQMITRPKELQAIYAKLPASAVAAIQKRDSSAGN